MNDRARIRVEQVSLAPRLFTATRRNAAAPLRDTPLLLNAITFEVFAGDRGAIVGASGAGKTLLLRLLNRLSEPTSGTVYFEGRPYATRSVEQLRQQVVLVLQEPKLLGMTVQQAVEYPLRLRRLPESAIRDRMDLWLERLQIPWEWRDRTELQLSVGQRQLVTIARALVTQPPVLLLDEPTAALDPGKAYQVMQLLREIALQHQTTILVTTHQLELAQAFGDRVLHLEAGCLKQNLPATQLDWIQLQHQLAQAENSSDWE